MKRFVVVLCAGALVMTAAVSGAVAGITETFTYPDGALTTVSGAAWQLWGPPFGGDAAVSSGVGVINPPTDVARLFPNELQVVGSVVNYSFDVMVPASGAGDYTFFFSPASLPLSTGQDYGNSLGFRFDWGTAGAGLTNVGIWPSGAPTNNAITTMTLGAFHTISGTMTKNAASISYTVLVDGNPVFAGNSTHTNPLGINCVEVYNQTGTGGTMSVDNIVLTPEPGTLSLLAIAGFALIRRRRN